MRAIGLAFVILAAAGALSSCRTRPRIEPPDLPVPSIDSSADRPSSASTESSASTDSSSAEPSSADPSSADPSSADPSSADPSSAELSPSRSDGSVDTAAAQPAGRARLRGRDDVVVRVGGRPVLESDLSGIFLYFFRDAWYEAIGYLIEREIVAAEAVRLDVRLREAEVAPALERELALQESEVRARFGDEVSLESFVADNFKEGMDAYRGRIEEIVRNRLLRDRVIRYSERLEETVDLRRIVVEARAEAEDLRSRVAAGADFEVLAREHSIVLSRSEGGRLERVRRGFLDPELESVAFSLDVGETSPVIEVEQDGRTLYHLIRVIRRNPGNRVSYGAVREEIAAELERRPVTQLEVLQWNRVQSRRYPVEYATAETPAR